MKKVSNYIKDSIKWLWQFPQNMLAMCIEGILCQTAYREGKADGNTIIVTNTLPSAMSLGDYIFVNPISPQITIQHECGHSKQSDILGPLYLIVIGLPSIIWACVHKYITPQKDYNQFFTEKWANKLMGM